MGRLASLCLIGTDHPVLFSVCQFDLCAVQTMGPNPSTSDSLWHSKFVHVRTAPFTVRGIDCVQCLVSGHDSGVDGIHLRIETVSRKATDWKMDDAHLKDIVNPFGHAFTSHTVHVQFVLVV